MPDNKPSNSVTLIPDASVSGDLQAVLESSILPSFVPETAIHSLHWCPAVSPSLANTVSLKLIRPAFVAQGAVDEGVVALAASACSVPSVKLYPVRHKYIVPSVLRQCD
jgi:hypothetical protein